MKFFPRIRIYKNRETILSLILNLSLILLIFYPLLTSPKFANAAVTEAFIRFDRLSTGTAISGTVCEKTGTAGTEASVVVVFPLGWTISGTPGNWTTTTTNLPTDPVGGGAASAWPGIGTATSVDNVSVVFPSTDLSTSTFYCFNFAGASSTVGAAANDQTGQIKTRTSLAVLIDTTNYATSVVSSGGELITVTASVSATMSFSLNSNIVTLGTLSTSAVTSGTVTQTVSTNARNGFVSWIKGTNWNGLYSSTANAMIFSPGNYPGIADLTVSAQKGYGLDAQPGTNTPVIAAGYQGSATTVGHIDSSLFRQVASLTGPQASTTVTLNVRAAITATQSAATDYSDILTVTAAGSF